MTEDGREEPQHDAHDYLEEIRRFATPQELRTLLRMVGTPDDLIRMHEILRRIESRQQQRAEALSLLNSIGRSLILVGAVLLLFRDWAAELKEWLLAWLGR